MSSDAADRSATNETFESLRREVVRLSDRLAALEAAGGIPSVPTEPRQSATVAAEGIGEEILAAISAALAAYLGVKPHIRQVSLVGGASWAQQGRVTIQASHALAIRHD